MSMVLVAAGSVTIVVMLLLFGCTVIDQLGDTGYTKPAILGLYGLYLTVAYGIDIVGGLI